tara:strand:- start:68 stop:271 length:204 start_codon:yes stop_codon:yes gene_type:complete
MDNIFEQYERDPSIAYELGHDDLYRLMWQFGEQEPIIDAILVASGASNQERAEQLGCSPSDFDYWID